MIVHNKYNFDDLKRFFILDHSSESWYNYTLFVEVPKINQIQAIAGASYPIHPEVSAVELNHLPPDIIEKICVDSRFKRMGGFRTTLKAVLNKYIHPRLSEISAEEAKRLYPEITQIEIVNGQCEEGTWKEYQTAGDRLWK